MCLAVPGKIISIDNIDNLRMAKVDFGGVSTSVCLEWLPEAEIGNYVIVHVGFALSIVDEKEAIETLKMISDIEQTFVGEVKNSKSTEDHR